MDFRRRDKNWFRAALVSAGASMAVTLTAPAFAWHGGGGGDGSGATTPIEHVIVVVGENHTYDNVYGGYVPVKGQTAWNLLSEGIIKADGSPGPNFANAFQNDATVNTTYSPTPPTSAGPANLQQPDTTYAYGVTPNVPDSRYAAAIPNGPFPLVKHGSAANGVDYFGSFTGDPVHRFFQMWQDYDGGKMDLFQWVGQTIGTGSNGNPVPFDTHQGGLAMGFNNMSQGDAPILKQFADQYATSDNYHQAVMGGTGANFIFLGSADLGYFTDSTGAAATPPSNQIENPDPVPSTNNWYTNDGYGFSTQAGSYVNCSDLTQHGVAPIVNYLNTLAYKPKANCDPSHYYLVNNYNPPYKADGSSAGYPAPGGTSTVYHLPPQVLPTIEESLENHGISWKYYNGGQNGGNPTDMWCSICNPLQFSKSVMTNSALRAKIQDVSDFYNDLEAGKLPAVSFVRPYESYAGHPADSSLAFYENFVKQLVSKVKAQKDVWKHTAIFLTMDEGGGYYDSGYIQSLDFFGDGTRIPFIAVSPYTKTGYVDHTYYDHGSIIKFIEANWSLPTLSKRSRDNLPNPVQASNSYAPTNGPAIGDLMNMFDFTKHIDDDGSKHHS